MTSLTPVGDYLRKRYPPNDGATHWTGSDGDPGCCAGPHATCLYGAAFREGAAAERERFRRAPAEPVPDFWGRIVRALWVSWAIEQPDPKPSWLVPWDELDEGQRDADRRIGAGISAVSRDDERERIKAGLPDLIERHREDLLYAPPECRDECYGKLLARLEYLIAADS